jgi:pilus assembly protein FimV
MAIDRSKVSKQAETYVASGKFDRAMEEFQKLIEDKPDDFNMLNRVGDVYFQMGRLPDAVEMFRRAAGGYERDGFGNKATAVLKKAHRAIPDDVDVAARLADLYRQTNMIKDAIQMHIEVAEVFTKKGLIKRALEEFAQVVELDPKNLKNKVKLADLYNKEGEKGRAAAIYLEVAEALALDQMHVEANQVLERAKAMVTTPQVFLTHSKLYIIQKDLAGAAAVLREGLGVNPRSSEILEALAELELQTHNPDKTLEVLAQVPQMAEKALLLCERALRELAKSGRVVLGLELFKPIGRDFARRGSGELAARALQNALQGNFTAEAWSQLAEIHHQSGNKEGRLDALRNAYVVARSSGDEALAEALSSQLSAFGVRAEDLAAATVEPSDPDQKGATATFDGLELDPVKRMQIQSLERDAENYVRNRFMDKAQEAYQKILDLDPTSRDAISRIADILKSSGRMSSVQMHYVKMAQNLVPLGHRLLAAEMLDRAEAMFPGSTRLYRRTLGLMDVRVEAAPAQGTFPSTPASFQPPVKAGVPIPVEVSPIASFPGEPPSAPPDPEPPAALAAASAFEIPAVPDTESLEAMLGLEPVSQQPTIALPRATPVPQAPPPAPWEALEVPGFAEPTVPMPWEAQPPTQPTPALPEAELELPLLDLSLPEVLPPVVPLPERLEMDWSDLASDLVPLELEPLELEPLPFVPAQAPPATGPVSPLLDEDLANLLPDIDFQLDYGSPEEAKAGIEEALRTWPEHPELLKRLETAEAALRKLGHEVKPEALEEADFTGSFFDLTDVLGEALMESGEGEEMHDATHVVEKIQSVEELFDAFREGVEQQVRGDDYDTHYNLGIAYKEMMLIEPAMEEFKKAMRDPERTLECCSMLSICELSQGNLEAAAQWLRTGIAAPGFPPEDAIGLRYDLGEILMQMGRSDEARAEFHQVYEMDTEYREVAQKI